MQPPEPTSQSVAEQMFQDETNSAMTVPEFEAFCEEVFKQNAEVKRLSREHDAAKEVLTKMKAKLLALMDEYGKSKYASNSGTLFTKNEFSVKTPKDPESREKFFAWLKEQGLFDDIITVNSRTLVSLYNSMLEQSGSPDFAIPGITEVSAYKTVSIRGK